MLLTVAWKGLEIMSGIQKIPRGEEVRNGVGDETWSRYKILHYIQRRRGWGKKTEFKIGKTGLQGEKTIFTNSCLPAVPGILPGGGPRQGWDWGTCAPDHTSGPWLFSFFLF